MVALLYVTSSARPVECRERLELEQNYRDATAKLSDDFALRALRAVSHGPTIWVPTCIGKPIALHCSHGRFAHHLTHEIAAPE